MSDQEKLTGLLRQIYGIATEKWTMTGKFAHIADLACEALYELGVPDPRYAHLEPYRTEYDPVPCLLCGSPLNRDGSCSADCAGVGDG